MTWIAYAVAVVLLLVYLCLWALRMRRRIISARDPIQKLDRCEHCGYILEKLDLPRCPECGRARGFSKSFEELGISESDVIAHISNRRGKAGRSTGSDDGTSG